MSATRKPRKSISKAMFARIASRHGARCGLCGLPMRAGDAVSDHIVPRSKGGPDALWNLWLAHAECNRKKGNKT
jgi:5-methylcytosine-specific restriction endonuclease McrA